jgi:hypothetical protein
MAKGSRCPIGGGLRRAPQIPKTGTARLLLPGAFFVPVGAQLFAPFVFVNFAFATFL